MKKKIFWLFFSILLIFFALETVDSLTLADYGSASFVSLDSVAKKEQFSESDYELIFHQTGLGKPAVDAIRQSKEDFLKELELFQKQRFTKLERERRYLFFPTTVADVIKEGDKIQTLKLPPLKNGDILITKSTKTLLYRHGHGAIVVEADKGHVIEAMMLGMPSAKTFTEGWESYATLMILRPKAGQNTADQAVRYANENLIGVPYQILTGLTQKDQSESESVSSTQCSHLVWQAYRSAGLDLDSDGGWLVTPCDLSASENLELVFSFGFGDDGKW